MIGKRIGLMAARSDEDSDDGTVAMSLWDAPLPLPHLSFLHTFSYDTHASCNIVYMIHSIHMIYASYCFICNNVMTLIRQIIKVNVGLMWLMSANYC
jgi:hypothetical protein